MLLVDLELAVEGFVGAVDEFVVVVVVDVVSVVVVVVVNVVDCYFGMHFD